MKNIAVWLSMMVFGAGLVSAQISLPFAVDFDADEWWTDASNGYGVWFGQRYQTVDGVDAAQSGGISDWEESYFGIGVVNETPGVLKFYWKVSSEPGYDWLRFYVDGEEEGAISGETEWACKQYVLDAGEHSLDWVFFKDEIASRGSDCGWVDRIEWTSVPALYTATFDVGEEGWVEPESKAIAPGFAYGHLPVPERDGFLFQGWWTGANGTGVRVTEESSAPAGGGDVALFAKWGEPLGAAVSLDNTVLEWELSGDRLWFGQTDRTHDGVDAMQSGRISDNQESVLATCVTGPGVLSFWWKVSSEGWCDWLRLDVDGETYGGKAISGETEWERVEIVLGEGDRDLAWIYSKDSSVDNGDDCGWVDQVTWTAVASVSTVTFDAGETGWTYPEDKMVVPESAYGVLPVPFNDNDGLVFRGWYTEENGSGTQVTHNTLVAAAVGDHTLYAHWVLRPSFEDALDTEIAGWAPDVGETPWTTQYDVSHDGTDAAYSGRFGEWDSGESILSATVEGPGILRFWWKTAVIAGYCRMGVFVDGEEQAFISGPSDWTQQTVLIGSGSHEIAWLYETDGDLDDPTVGGWLDQVSWTPVPLYVLYFDARGGEVGQESKQIAQGVPYGKLPVPYRQGYIFDGWWTGPDGTGSRIAPETLVASSANHIMAYAKWGNAPTFEEALDSGTAGLEWYTGFEATATAPWYTVFSGSHDGIDAAQSGPVGESGGCLLVAWVEGPGALSFWWKTASEENGGYLRFYVDGEEWGSLSGNTGWELAAFRIESEGYEGEGLHELSWEYVDETGAGAGCGWLDQVEWTAAPVITRQPADAAVRSGATTTLTVGAESTSPLTYFWYEGEGDDREDLVPAGQGADFTTPPVTAASSYWVRVVDALGQYTDSRAVRVMPAFEIRTAADLQKMGSGFDGWMPDAAYLVMNDIDASETAGWNEGAGFEPIGWDDPFTGILDGQGYTIGQLTINRPDDGAVGLFGVLENGAFVKNVKLSDCTVIGGEEVGGLAGVMYESSLQSCSVSGAVAGGEVVGGLIGSCGYGTVQSCYASGPVSGQWGAGGLIGNLYGYSSVYSCYAVGAVDGMDQTGGLIGYAEEEAIVEDSYWDSEASGQTVSAGGEGRTTVQMQQQGTFIGWDFSAEWGIVNGASYPYLLSFPHPFSLTASTRGAGGVTAAPAADRYAPGATVTLTAIAAPGQNEFVKWVGAVSDPLSPVTTVRMDGHKSVLAVFRTFKGLASIADVQKIGSDPAYPADGRYWLEQDIDATETAQWNDEGTDEIEKEGFRPIGRFSGVFDGNGHTVHNLFMNRSYSDENYCTALFSMIERGAVVANLGLTACRISGRYNVGSLACENYGVIERCYATGAVMGSPIGSYDDVYTNAYDGSIWTNYTYSSVGGFVCYNEGSLSECYAAVAVDPQASDVGGFVCWRLESDDSEGYRDVIERCFWDFEVSGLGADQSLGGTACQTVAMKQTATFEGWDFAEVWMIEEGIGYPSLRSFDTFVIGLDASGAGDMPMLGLVAGRPFGNLPSPARPGFAFGGWWTGPGGTGEQVLPTDIVTDDGSLRTLYAKWTALSSPPPPPPISGGGGYLCDPAGDAELATAGAYDGYLYAAEAFGGGQASAVRGTLSLKVTGLAGKLTAKAVLQGGSVSFKGAVWSAPGSDGTRHAELDAAGGERLDLYVRQNRIWGTLSGGKAGAALTLDGARNRFAERGDTAAAALLDAFKGYYTVALPAAEGGTLSASDAVDAAPQGAGYLTVTVGAKGSAKIAGVLADGTKVAQAGRLLLFDGCGPAACVPLFAPLYTKKGWVGGLLWIDPETRTVETDRDIGWFIRWENPGRSGPDGFSLLLDACGGFYGTGASLASAYLFGAETEGTVYFDALGEPRDWSVLPETVPVTAAGASLSVAKGAKPKKVSEEGDVSYEYDEVNPANVTLTFASRTGLFKGKFNLYCDYEDATGKVVHKAVSVPYAGVLAPVRGGAFDGLPAGLGHCLIPDSDPAVKPYRLKRSRPVWLGEQ